MKPTLSDLVQRVDTECARSYAADLKTAMRWVAVPSVSLEPEHLIDCNVMAALVEADYQAMGFETSRFTTPKLGLPAVYMRRVVNPSAPTLFFYFHGDVKPAQKEDGWTQNNPFRAVTRDGKLFGRGTADDKAHHLIFKSGLAAYLKTYGTSAMNVEGVAEWGEEVGSAEFDQIANWVSSIRGSRPVDFIVVTDSGWVTEDDPTICIGLRGQCKFELKVTVATKPTHTGIYGGGIQNAIFALCHIVAKTIDANGTVSAPGFYPGITVSDSERVEAHEVPFDRDAFLSAAGVTDTTGYAGLSTVERTTAWPTADATSVTAGWQKEGVNTTSAHIATMKFACRLVNGQDPQYVFDVLKSAFENAGRQITGDSGKQLVTVELGNMGGSPALYVPSNNVFVQAASRAMTEVLGKRVIPARGGGSIPALNLLLDAVTPRGATTPALVMPGFVRPSDGMHEANEHIGLDVFKDGRTAMARMLAYSHDALGLATPKDLT